MHAEQQHWQRLVHGKQQPAMSSSVWLPEAHREFGGMDGGLLFIPAAAPPRQQITTKRAAQGPGLLANVLSVHGATAAGSDEAPVSPKSAAGHSPKGSSRTASISAQKSRNDFAAATELLSKLEVDLGMRQRQPDQFTSRVLRTTPAGQLVGSVASKRGPAGAATLQRPAAPTTAMAPRPAPMTIRTVQQQARTFVAAASATATVAGQAFDAAEDQPPLSGCSTDNDEVDETETASDISAPQPDPKGKRGAREQGSADTYLHPWVLGGASPPLFAPPQQAGYLMLQATSSILQQKPPAPGVQLGAGAAGSGASGLRAAGRPPKVPTAPGSPSAAAAAQAQGVLAFWGGDQIPRAPGGGAKLSKEALSQLAGSGTKKGSRPGTASSYWSHYDLDEGALERSAREAETEERRRARKQADLMRSSSVGRSRAGVGTPAKRPDPYVRVLHPAVIMDLALITPVTKPVPEVPLDEKGRPYPYVLPPTFPGAYPTIAFMGPAEQKQASGLHPLLRVRMAVRYAGIANSPVKAAFKEAGWRVVKGKHWNVCWGHIFSAAEFAGLHEFQRVNHFPGTWELGRKDHLYRNVAALRRKKGEALDIVPRFFVMPRDYEEFRADLERNPDRLYIQKPVNSSRGRGVRMVVKPAELPRDIKDVLVQHYINNPYTINGYKFDMRIYVAATSFDPLRLYVYHDGLARFATERYSDDKADLKKRCVHLTNYSVNKKSTKFVANSSTEEESAGSKWSLSALRAHIEGERGRAAWVGVWRQVHNIIAAAVIAAEPRINTEVKMKVPHRNICFEVWGFDIMLDDALRAWLIEVNTCPALAADSPLDRRVKNNMIADVMNLVGPVPYDTDVYEVTKEAARQARLTGLAPSGPRSASATPGTPSAGTSGTRTGASTPAGRSTPVGGARSSGAASAASTPRGGAQKPWPGAGGSAAGPRPPPQVPRTIREAEQLDLRGLPPEQLPDVVVEAEAEFARKRGWERVFPAEKDPCRYLDLFDTQRASNIVLCKYYTEKAGRTFDLSRATGSGAVSTPSSSSRPSRPAISDWRPGGML